MGACWITTENMLLFLFRPKVSFYGLVVHECFVVMDLFGLYLDVYFKLNVYAMACIKLVTPLKDQGAAY